MINMTGTSTGVIDITSGIFDVFQKITTIQQPTKSLFKIILAIH